MPTLIFTQADVTTTFNQWDGGITPVLVRGSGGTIPATLTDVNFGEFSVSGIISDSNVLNPSAAFQVSSEYIKVGTVNFAARVPALARITQVVVRIDVSCNCQLTVSGTTGGSASLDIDLPSEFQTDPPAIHETQSTSVMPVNLLVVEEHTAPESETTFDYTGGVGYISRALLISNHGTPQMRLISNFMSCSGNGVVPGTATLNFNLAIDYWQIAVTYDMAPTEWTISHSTTPLEPTDPGPPVVPGSIVTITSPSPESTESLDMEQITSMTARFLDGSSVPIPEFLAYSPFLLEFTTPEFIDQPILIIEIESTQFSGSLELGMLVTVYFLSASGLYQLDLNATHDTLYIEDDLPETIDVKIPNPTIKTGFIDG